MAIAIGCVLAAAALLQTEPAAPERWTARVDVGPVAVTAEVPRLVALADAITIDLTLMAPAHVELRWPELAGEPARRLIDAKRIGPDPVGRFSARRWIARLEPLQLGRLDLGSVVLEYRDGTKEWQRGSIALPIVTVVPGPTSSDDPATLRPIPFPPSPSPSRLGWWLKVSGAVLLAMILTVLVAQQWRGRKGGTFKDAALTQLSLFEQGGLPPRELIHRTAEVVRRYLECHYRLDTAHRTTPEFLADEQLAQRVAPEQRAALEEFLESADLERFGSEEPDRERAHRCVRRARAFLAGERAASP